MHGIYREVPIQSQYLVNRQCSILLIGDPYFVCLCEVLCFNLQPRYNRDNVERQPGADPGFCVRGDESRREVWGPLKVSSESRTEPW